MVMCISRKFYKKHLNILLEILDTHEVKLIIMNKNYLNLTKEDKLREKRNFKNLIGAFHLNEKTDSVKLKKSLYEL